MSSCKACKFWRWNDPKDIYRSEEGFLLSDEADNLCTVGHCQRFPPVLNVVEFEEEKIARLKESKSKNFDQPHLAAWLSSDFPITSEDLWCGEFQPAETAKLPSMISPTENKEFLE